MRSSEIHPPSFDDIKSRWTSAAAPSINTPVLTALDPKEMCRGQGSVVVDAQANDVRLRLEAGHVEVLGQTARHTDFHVRMCVQLFTTSTAVA